MDTFQFVRKGEISDLQWDQLVQESPDGWLYQTSAWINYASRWGSDSRSFAVFAEGQQLVGVFPLYREDLRVSRIVRLRRLHTGLSGPALSARISPKSRRKLLKAIFDHIDEIAASEKIDLLQVRLTTLSPSYLPPRRQDVNPLFYVGCTSPLTLGMEVGAVQPLTRILYLDKPEDQLLMEMDTDCRAAVRQAERKGLQFVEGDATDSLNAYFHLHQESWKRTGLAPHPYRYFEDMQESLRLSNSLKIFFAVYAGRTVAAMMIHLFKEGAFYWGGCSSGDSLALRPNNFLLWNVVRWAKASGYRFFEIGQYYPHPTVSLKEYNVGKFKTQFGRDELVPYEGQKIYRNGKFLLIGVLKSIRQFIKRPDQ